MYDPAGESAAKKALTLPNENLTDCRSVNREKAGPLEAHCGLGGGWLEIITPKSAMALKTDVHLSVIYSTRPVSADKVNLACQPPPGSWIALPDTSGSQSRPGDAECPRMDRGPRLVLHLRLHNICLHVCLRVSVCWNGGENVCPCACWSA